MSLGAFLVWGLIGWAGILVVPAVSHTNAETTLSLMASSMAFTGMGIALFLATRPPFAERLFGGLDRIYQLHRRIGIAVLFLILIHYFVVPNFRGLSLTASLSKLAAEMGQYAFYLLAAQLTLSIVKIIPGTRIEIPYQVWRLSHRLIGVLFVMVSFHQTFIKRPYDGTAMIATYLNIFAMIGTASYLYTQLLPWVRRRGYTVVSVERHEGATIVMAKPKRWPLRAKPGQFGFLRVKKTGLREPHPFTIAGLEADGTVCFAIRALGDYTRVLRERIAVGDRLTLEGGYGHFDHRRGGGKQIWLAGGIGVTPFLAMAGRLTGEEGQAIHMVYCVRNAEEAIGVDMFEAQAKKLANFRFTLHVSSTQGRLDAVKLAEASSVDPKGADLWYCGPSPLRRAIVRGLADLGTPPRRIEFEAFEFR